MAVQTEKWPQAETVRSAGTRPRGVGAPAGRWLLLQGGVWAALLVGAAILGERGASVWAAVLAVLAVAGGVSTWRLKGGGQTDRQAVQLDERLVQTQKMAAIGELAAGIAHEINNPLAIIRQEADWMVAILTKSSRPSEEEMVEVQGSAREIISQVERGKEITHNLLDFARRRTPVIQSVQVNRLIEDMARLVEREAKGHQIEIRRDLAADLTVIRSDPPLLRQVILNLLNNAVQAIGRGGTITVTSRAMGPGMISIEVQDTGSGIAAEILPHIFDPFFTTKPPGSGTGLGLALCYSIIDKLGGTIGAQSEPGQGAVFTITLPVQPPEGEGT